MIRGGIYGRTIPMSEIAGERAEVLDLTVERDRRLGMRTNGIGLPGYRAGWFRLRNGEKALAFVTANRVVYVPTRQHYSVLVSAAQPEALAAALQVR